MCFLRLTYTRAKDPTQFVSLYGEPAAIRDLYWQLTHNYKAQDGTEIGSVDVFDQSGNRKTDEILTNPWGVQAPTTTIE